MSTNPNLTRSLGRGLKLQALYISIAAFVGVFAAALLLEDVLIKQALRGEAEYFWEQYAIDPDRPLPDTRNMTSYREGTGAGVPADLRDLPVGFHQLHEPEAIAFVSQRNDARLYLVFNNVQVSELIALFGLLPLAFVLIVVYLSLYSAYRVSQRAVSPVIALAERVRRLDPAAPDVTLFSADRAAVGDDDEVRVLAAAMQDLTERVVAFAERERNFTRDASHELRSPLTVIKMAAGMLQQSAQLGDADRRSVARILQAASDMEELTSAFLLLARESTDALAYEQISVNAIVAGEVDRARVLAEDKDVEVTLSESHQFSVHAPEKVLASMVGNLLRNGLNYTDQGTVSVQVEARRVVIADTGPGMSPGEVEKVFKPFYRSGRQRGGHGVGLTIVKRLSERFGWPVHVDSEPGQGTTVTIFFPESPQKT